MSERIFHCPSCGLLAEGLRRGDSEWHCVGCDAFLTDLELRRRVRTVASKSSTSQGGESRRSSASGGELRRRETILPGVRSDKDEARDVNRLVVFVLGLGFAIGLTWAGIKAYEAYQLEQRRARIDYEENQEANLISWQEINQSTDDGKLLHQAGLTLLKAYFSEPMISRRVNFIQDSGRFAARMESYYVRNSDRVDVGEIALESLYQSRLLHPRRWLLRCRIAGVERDFVMVNQEDSVRLDWAHCVALGSERWEDFLESETPEEGDFRLFAWLVNQTEGAEEVLLLRMAAPFTPGRPELAEVSPIVRISAQTDIGARLAEIFEELPENENEAGFPRSAREDAKMRQLHLRLRTEGLIKGQPMLEVLEVIAADWVTAASDERLERAEVAKEQQMEPENESVPNVPSSQDDELP